MVRGFGSLYLYNRTERSAVIEVRKPMTDKCKLCGKFLSSYNPADICWSHREHPDYKKRPVEWEYKTTYNCSSHTPAGLVRATLDYYGEPKDL